MVCSNCGNEISKDSKFCDRCGSKAPSKHNKLKSNKKICNRCGSKISSNAEFCYKCGNKTSAVNSNETDSYNTENNNAQTDYASKKLVEDISNNTENNNVQTNDVSKKIVENIPKQSTEQQNFDSPNLNSHTKTNKKGSNTKLMWLYVVVAFLMVTVVLPMIIIFSDTTTDTSSNTNTEATIEVPEEELQEVVEEPVQEVVQESESTLEPYFNGIELTQVYTNEVEGVSFNYPEDWNESIPSGDEPGNVVYLRSPMEQSTYTNMTVTKMDVSLPGASVSRLSYLIEGSLLEDGVEIQERIDTSIDGIYALKMIATVDENSTSVMYMYNINGDVYTINFLTDNEKYDEYSPIFDAIMESYKISLITERSNQEQNSDDYGLSEEEALEVAREFFYTHPLMYRTITGYIEYEPEYNVPTKGLYLVEMKNSKGSRGGIWVDKKTGNIFVDIDDGESFRDGEEAYQEFWVANQDKDAIVFDGKKISSYIGTNPDYVYANFGKPKAGTKIDGSLDNGFGYIQYDNLKFMYNGNNSITDIIGDAKTLSYNGETLDKTRDEIVDLFGEPDNEHKSFTGNYENYEQSLEYVNGKFTTRFEFDGKGGKAFKISFYVN